MFRWLVLAHGHLGVGAVHRTGGREHQVLDVLVAAAFQHMQRTGDIATDVHMRILGGITHADLCGQVHHAPGLMGRGAGLDGGAVDQVSEDVHVGRMLHEPGQAGLLQVHVVLIAEVVETDFFVAALEQAQGDMGTDESGGAGDQDFHLSGISGWGGSGLKPLLQSEAVVCGGTGEDVLGVVEHG